MAVALDLHEARHLDGAGTGDPAHIVAAEIHQHEVFRPLLLVGEQLARMPLVLRRRGPARSRPGDRAHGHDPVFDADEGLGGRADEAHAVQFDEEEIGRRVAAPECAVQLEGVAPETGAGALRDDDLVRVACHDVLADSLDGRLVVLPRAVSGHLRGARPAAAHRPQPVRSLEAANPVDEPVHGLPVQFGRVVIGRDRHGRHGDGPRIEVVDDEHVLRRHEAGVGHAEVVRRRRGQPLEPAYRIVAEESDGPAPEPRQGGEFDRFVTVDPRIEGAERVARRLGLAPASRGRPEPDLRPVESPRFPGLRAEKAESRPAFPPLHRLEQEGERAASELREGRDRSVEVERDLDGHGHHPAGLGEAGEFGKVGDDGGVAHAPKVAA